MKILIDQLASINAEHIRSVQELSKDHQIVYWIRIEGVVQLDADLFPGTIFHDYLDAAKNVPPKQVDASVFLPLSRDEIVQYAQWEAELMSMMEKGYSEWSIDKRKDFYYQLLRYWSGILDTYAPDCIIFNSVPHQVFNFVLYAIAKKRDIRTIIFDVAVGGTDRIIWSTDYKQGNEMLSQAQGYGEIPVELEDLPPYIQDHYRKVSSMADPTPPYIADSKRASTPLKNLWRRGKSLAPHIKDGSIFERGMRRLAKQFRPTLEGTYHRLQCMPDWHKPYVYVPLHYQPECTTSPQGDIYVEQLQMIRTLSAALPLGWELYVKEHPVQWRLHWGDFTPQRYRGFYEALADIPHVRIMPLSTSTFQLLDRAQTTATVSGTPAWESILRGKCALVFGYPWFMHAPGVFRVSSVSQCRSAFMQIQEGLVPQKSQIMKYLGLLSKVVFSGSLSIAADMVKSTEGDLPQWQGMHRAMLDSLRA